MPTTAKPHGGCPACAPVLPCDGSAGAWAGAARVLSKQGERQCVNCLAPKISPVYRESQQLKYRVFYATVGFDTAAAANPSCTDHRRMCTWTAWTTFMSGSKP